MIKKSLGLIFASFIVLCGLSVVSFAQSNHPKHRGNINQRQENQQRIRHGNSPQQEVRLNDSGILRDKCQCDCCEHQYQG